MRNTVGAFSYLQSAGLTNSSAPDYGDFTNRTTAVYDYYCSSTECRFKFSPIYKGRPALKDEIFKIRSEEWHPSCPDCRKPLHSYRVGRKARK
jgi:hypothetical protein